MPPSLSIPFQFRPRGYLHFDAPVSQAFAQQNATDAAAVARHAFYPFILHPVVTRKIKKRAGGGVEVKPPKVRPIAYAAHLDSHLYAHYGAILEHCYEPALRQRGLHEVVTAFRSLSGRSNVHFANEAFEFIRSQDTCFVLASDISDFFNQLDHRQLKRAWARLIETPHLPADHYAVYKAITRYCTVDRAGLFQALEINPHRPRASRRHRLCSPQEFRDRVRASGLCVSNRSGKGIPQGSPISAVLANLYLLEFDTLVNAFVARHGGLYRRYCDDLLVVLPAADLRAQAQALITGHLTGLRLEAHPDKTEQLDFVRCNGRLTTAKPLNYLGFTFDGEHKRVRSASIARYYRKMRRGVGRANAVRYRVWEAASRQAWTQLRRRKLHLLYSYLGRHNFPSYVYRAARIMNDPGMKKQIQPHWHKLQALIDDAG